MRDHPDLQERIPEYVAGGLSDDDRERIERHLAECHECEGLVACCEAIAARLRAPDHSLGLEHPEPATWVAYARGSLRDEALTRHLASCPSCALEVEVWSRWKPDAAAGRAELPPIPRAAHAFRPRNWRPFLAGAAAGVVACLAILPWIRGGRGEPIPEPAAWGGRAPFVLLEDAARNGGTSSSVRVGPGQPFIPLGIRVSLPPAVSDGDRFDFTIHSAASASGGSVSWSQELSAEQIREEQSRAWLVGFLVPAKLHPPGRYVFRVAPVGGNGRSLMEVPFEILP